MDKDMQNSCNTNIYTFIIDNNGECVGINEISLGNGFTKEIKKYQKTWINDVCVIDVNKNKQICFIEYYPLHSSKIKFRDYFLLEKSLKKDIKELLKYSYCIQENEELFYFPTIKLVIWTNKELSKPGYSIAVYEYGYYDQMYSDQDLIKNQINNTYPCNAQIGETIIIKPKLWIE